ITKNGALKQDILKELEKQNIRDTIVDSITKELNTVQAVAVVILFDTYICKRNQLLVLLQTHQSMTLKQLLQAVLRVNLLR
ncbi:hypothetical protein HDV02_003487, partial [Globomyces sp. JEL0801]